MKFRNRSIFILIAVLAAPGRLAAIPAAQVITLQVTAEQANIREKPDVMSPVLKQIVSGGILEAEKKEGEWYTVRVDLDTGGTIIGYVHESLVRVVAGAPVEARPAPKVVKEAPPEKLKAPPAETKETPNPATPPPPRTEAPAKAPAHRPPREPAGRRGSISLWYGGGYAVVGDLNDGAKGLADYFASELGVKKSKDAGSVHLGKSFGAEYRYPLAFGLDAAIGAGYFSAEKTSTIGFEGRPETTRYLTGPSVRAVPISLALLFHPLPGIYAKAGAELAFARCEYLYRFEQGGSSREWQGKAHATKLGYALAGGLERGLMGPVSVIAEAGYRKLRVGSLSGEEVYRETGKPDVTTKGNLYFSRNVVAGGSSVPEVFIRASIPGGTGVVEARPAELSLSGLSLRAGLKIAF